jgi:L-asparaginase II
MTTLREALERLTTALHRCDHAGWDGSCTPHLNVEAADLRSLLAAQALADNAVDADKRERIARMIMETPDADKAGQWWKACQIADVIIAELDQ